MEVADEIVVINEGRVEQVGTPDQLYDEPANPFVMGFLGETTVLNGVTPPARRARLAHAAAGRRVRGERSRLLRVGFEVRVTVLTDDGEEVHVVPTRPTRASSSSRRARVFGHPGDRGDHDAQAWRPSPAEESVVELVETPVTV